MVDKVVTFPGPKPAAVAEPPVEVTDLNIPPEKAEMYEAVRRTFDFLFANKDNLYTFALVATLKNADDSVSGVVLNSGMKPEDYSYLLHMFERDFQLNAFG